MPGTHTHTDQLAGGKKKHFDLNSQCEFHAESERRRENLHREVLSENTLTGKLAKFNKFNRLALSLILITSAMRRGLES